MIAILFLVLIIIGFKNLIIDFLPNSFHLFKAMLFGFSGQASLGRHSLIEEHRPCSLFLPDQDNPRRVIVLPDAENRRGLKGLTNLC